MLLEGLRGLWRRLNGEAAAHLISARVKSASRTTPCCAARVYPPLYTSTDECYL